MGRHNTHEEKIYNLGQRFQTRVEITKTMTIKTNLKN